MSKKYRVIRHQKNSHLIPGLLAEDVSTVTGTNTVTASAIELDPAAADETDPDTAAEKHSFTDEDMQQLKYLVRYYEQMLDYAEKRNRPWRFIWLNLLSGMAKGFGIALGITVIAFIAFKILVSLQILDLPIIGNFLAELIEYINSVQNIV